ncbi:MAG: hypothetical protein GY937_08200 [bacterium]|nr:hypothetical protein [bacterium]
MSGRLIVAFCGALLIARTAIAESDTTALRDESIHFVHVEGNVGGASGGHSALRLGETLFHYQHDGDVFRLVREPWTTFQLEYGGFQNRPLHVARVPAEARALEQIQDHLTSLHLAQVRRLRERLSTQRDRRLLEALTGRASGVPVTAAGLLDPQRAGDPYAEALRARVTSGLQGGLPGRLVRAEQELRDATEALWLRPDGAAPSRARDALALREALRALIHGDGLAEGVLVDAARVDVELSALTGGEHRALANYAERLAARASALLDSPRTDRGIALLRLQARWLAVQHSLEEGRWLALDPYADRPATITAADARLRKREFAALAEQGRVLLEEQRQHVLVGVPEAAGFNLLEDLLGRTAEAARGARGEAIRDARERLLPSRSREVGISPAPAGRRPERALALAQEREQAVSADLRQRYGYDLLTRNCSTELQRALVGAFGTPEAERQALGGSLTPNQGLGFIPWRYFLQVVAHYPVAEVERLPSHRERLLADLYARPGRWRTYLREAGVLTSSLYTPRDRDGSFLFFTDDARWLRPVYGTANLLAGLGDTGVGALIAPFDRGRRLLRGARGVLFSLPELAFGNIRKGSFDLSTLPPLMEGNEHAEIAVP